MKNILLLFLVISFTFCSPKNIAVVNASKETKDSIVNLKSERDSLLLKIEQYRKQIVVQMMEINSLNDSVKTLNFKPFMSTSQFIELYKYKWLIQYYNLCNKKPVYWKYYRGWSTRVFEAENKNYKPTDFVPDATTLPGFK